MDMAERGMYITLLCFAWQDGSIPGSMTEISRMCSLPERKAVTLWNRVSECFAQHETQHDRLINPRMELVRLRQLAYSEERKESGKRGAAERWKEDSSAIAKPTNENASPSPSLTLTSEEGKEPLAISSPVVPKYTSAFENFWKASTQRGSKKQAFAEWRKLGTFPQGALAQIHGAMAQWRQSAQWQDETKQPHICNWLKRRGWEEIVPKRAIAENLRGSVIERPVIEEHTTHICNVCDRAHEWPCDQPELCTRDRDVSCPEFVRRFTH